MMPAPENKLKNPSSGRHANRPVIGDDPSEDCQNRRYGGADTYMRNIGVTFLGLSADVTVIAAGLRGLAGEAQDELELNNG